VRHTAIVHGEINSLAHHEERERGERGEGGGGEREGRDRKKERNCEDI